MMHNLGVISALFVILACAIPVIGRIDKSLTISRHAAQNRWYWLYVGLSSIGLLMFYVFMLRIYIPELGFSSTFSLILTVGLFCDLISLYIPDSGGFKSKAHGFLAYTMMLSIPVMVLYVVMTPNIDSVAKLIGLFTLNFMVTTLVSMRKSEHVRRNILAYQSIYIVSYFFTILSSYFLSIA